MGLFTTPQTREATVHRWELVKGGTLTLHAKYRCTGCGAIVEASEPDRQYDAYRGGWFDTGRRVASKNPPAALAREQGILENCYEQMVSGVLHE